VGSGSATGNLHLREGWESPTRVGVPTTGIFTATAIALGIVGVRGSEGKGGRERGNNKRGKFPDGVVTTQLGSAHD
jgi:hypothetical protein